MIEQTLQHILKNHLEDIVIVTDNKGYISWANQWFEEITGYKLEEVKGKKAGSFLQGEETDPETVQVMRTAIAAGKSFNVNVINYSKSGRKYWLNINCSAIYNKDNELEHFIAVERDITSEHEKNQNKLNNLIKELQKMSAEKSELIQMIYLLTHDLKAPINNIGQLFELVTDYDETVGNLIKQEVERSKTLINKILSKDNIGPNNVTIEPTDFSLLSVINSLHEVNKINLTKNKLSVSIDCLKGIIIHSDKVLLTQILENLFVNAIKYSNPSSEIKFEAKELSDTVKIIVSNETDALEDWQLTELFKPFQNFNMESSEASTGIGTFIVTKYLGLIGGTIEVTKTNNRVFFEINIKKSLEKPNMHLKAV
jgi:PAS domain S-box-containing protein